MEYIYYCPDCGYFNVKEQKQADTYICSRCNKTTYETNMSKQAYMQKSNEEKEQFKQFIKETIYEKAYFHAASNYVTKVINGVNINVSQEFFDLNMKYSEYNQMEVDKKNNLLINLKNNIFVHLDFLGHRFVYLNNILKVDEDNLQSNDYIFIGTYIEWEKLTETGKKDLLNKCSYYKQKYLANILKKSMNVIITTADLKVDYDVKGLVYYQINNRGIVKSQISV